MLDEKYGDPYSCDGFKAMDVTDKPPTIIVETTPSLDGGRIEQSVLYQDFMGIREKIDTWIINTRDEGIRRALLDLGWSETPLKIGKYEIRKLSDGNVWIDAEGEGMETTEEKLVAVLGEFFAREF
jgi:hypothetical protein